jgi:hypothetical protein
MLSGLAIGALLLSGNLACQSFPSMDVTAMWSEKGPVGKPTEVAALWQEGVDVQLDGQNGGRPIAGFAGRIFFTQVREGQPAQTVLINGDLQIQLFDDRPSTGGPATPLETWTIKPEHQSPLVKKDITGWGYSVWLPWNTFSRDIRNVRMIVQYVDKDGSVIRSEPSAIKIQDAHQGGIERPKLETRQFQQKTWLPQQQQ